MKLKAPNGTPFKTRQGLYDYLRQFEGMDPAAAHEAVEQAIANAKQRNATAARTKRRRKAAAVARQVNEGLAAAREQAKDDIVRSANRGSLPAVAVGLALGLKPSRTRRTPRKMIYECPICGAKRLSRSGLYRHLRSYHNQPHAEAFTLCGEAKVIR